MLDRFKEQNMVAHIQHADDFQVPDEVEEAIKELVRVSLESRVDMVPAHYIDSLTKESKSCPTISIGSVLGVTGHYINTIIREELIEQFEKKMKLEERYK